MKFYERKKPYKYGRQTVFFWKYEVSKGQWKHGGSVYWGKNRETEIIKREGIQRIAELSDSPARRNLIRNTAWLNRGEENYSDEHFSKSIKLRLEELKKQTPRLSKTARRAKLAQEFNEVRSEFYKFAKESELAIFSAANHFRNLGVTWQMLTGHKRLFNRDYLKWRSSLPKNVTADFLRLALSTSVKHPIPIKDFESAWHISRQLEILDRQGK